MMILSAGKTAGHESIAIQHEVHGNWLEILKHYRNQKLQSYINSTYYQTRCGEGGRREQRRAHGRKREKGSSMITHVVRSISLDNRTAYCTHTKQTDFLIGSPPTCDIVSLKTRRIPTV